MNEHAVKEIKEANFTNPLEMSAMGLDPRIAGLIDALGSIRGKKILDSSTLDGFHACQLSELGALVTASDIRPHNLMKALYRAIYHRIDSIKYRLIDLEDLCFEVGKDEFDIHFWSGSFYHLKNPIQVFILSCFYFKYILLETHVAEEGRHEPIVAHRENEKYKGYWYKEHGWNDSLSGKDEQSFWLTETSLKQLIKDCGFEIQKIIYEGNGNPIGKRNCYLLRRND